MRQGSSSRCGIRVWLCVVWIGILGVRAWADAAAAPKAGLEVSGRTVRFGLVTVDVKARQVSFPARCNMTQGILEYAVVADYGKTHESLLITDAAAVDLQSGLLLLNAVPAGTNAVVAQAGSVPPGAAVTIRVSWQDRGRRVSRRLEELVGLKKGGSDKRLRSMTRGPWVFSGSMITVEGFGAHFEGSYVSLIRDPIAIVNNPRADAEDDDIHVPQGSRLPPVGTDVVVEWIPEPRR